ncbi:MAG: flavin reductase [Deltaproteobacteria bacterium]|nr:flavin reductase [Deltaproteobacteria bacterium]
MKRSRKESVETIFASIDHEVFLITTHFRGKDAGQIATWVMPATLVPEPTRIVVILSPYNFTCQLIEKSKKFVLHLLAANQHRLMPRFGLPSSRDVNKFKGIKITRTKSGLPIIPGTCGWAECKVLANLDSGDRKIILAEVIQQKTNPTKQPLTKNAAFSKVSQKDFVALVHKRINDGLRDRKLMKKFV